jgi:hypothetical protein
MLTAAWLLASALAVTEDARPPEPEIRAAGGEVTIHVRNVPVSQILDRLSSATGMDLTYEGARPTTPVTLSLDGISEAQAIVKLMEGLGVSYVFRTDDDGQRVDLLIVSGAGAGTLVPPQPAALAEQPYEPVVEFAHVPLDPAVLEAAGGHVKPDLNNPYMGLPPQHFPPAQQQAQPTEGMETGEIPSALPGGRQPRPARPSFPQGSSYPTR